MLRKLMTLAIVLAAAGLVLAQTSAPKIQLSGTYTLTDLNVGETEVSMTFTATVTNNGVEDVTGPIALNDANVIQKVFYRFGEQSIAAGKYVTVSGLVSVPRQEYDSWARGGPSLFFVTQNDRGDIKTVRIGLSRSPAPASN